MPDALLDMELASKVTHVDNVFAALDVPDSAVERHKVGLAVLINRALALEGDTQIERAIALGVAQPVVSNLERYELAGISSDRLIRYCEHLGVEIAPPSTLVETPAAASRKRR